MTRISKRKLAALIEEATVDAYNESEQAAGWHAQLDLRGDNSIVAVCTRGRQQQAIPILDLPLPSPKPAGAEWLEAYRHWLGA